MAGADFLLRWQSSGGAERANYQLFLAELCDFLGVARPEPSGPDNAKNTYVFDRSVTSTLADGSSTTTHFIDLYKQGCFVLETKQGVQSAEASSDVFFDSLAPAKKVKKGHGVRGTKAFDDALIRAKGQAEAYVRSIPDDNPPFVVVVDVGHSIELYSDFSRLGKTYVPFLGAGKDPHSHRVYLADLADAAIRDRLSKLWTEPLSLDPSRRSAAVTRDIAANLAELAKSLERSGNHPESVAQFLMRCLFTLFAEDVQLIKDNAFTRLLESLRGRAREFKHMLPHVWREMDRGTEFSPVLRQKLLRFNGGLFEETEALDLSEEQLVVLIHAAKSDWKHVEPAIFGTLLERALHPDERHKLGAHYTPRAYVERLVLPTVIEPLRDDWKNTQAAAFTLANAGKRKEALEQLHGFLKKLCNTYVLDPACGSGNFLYVTLEHLKRLEAEVRDTLHQLGEAQLPLEYVGLTVDPHQLLGLEINPRAAAIADLVLWIGYLQWHFKTQGTAAPAEPVLKKFDNIKEQDAVLAYDRKELVLDEQGKPVTRWDGRTYKKHPVTGENIPDEAAALPNL